jgi:hypothetical protein
VRQLVDHPAEQKGFGELGDREGDIGEDERQGQPFLWSEQPQHPAVEFYE